MRLIVLDTPEKRLRALDAVRAAAIDAERPLCVKIAPYERTRSSEQNRRYWALLGDIAEQCRPKLDGKPQAFDRDQWHEYFAGRWLPKTERMLPNGRMSTQRRSTTDLTSQEFSDYMTRVEVWGANHEVVFTGDF